MKPVLVVFFSLLTCTYSCKERKDDCCKGKDSMLFVHPVNCSFRLPEYTVKDTIKFGDLDNEMHYNIVSKDSLIKINVSVTNYKRDVRAMPELMILKYFQKKEIEYGRNWMQLVADTILNLDGIDVGYVKYSDAGSKKGGLESHVFFNLGVRQVVLWIFDKRKYGKGEISTVSDCIFKSFRIGH